RLCTCRATDGAGRGLEPSTSTSTSFEREKNMNTIKNFFKDETGLELSEYAVAAGLVALAVVVAFTNLGSAIDAGIKALAGKIKTT
ncbi:MAG: hypothetical protein ACREBD_30400, partial [Blastocatellia bacterium]